MNGQDHKVACIGFYNFENLFDTVDEPDKHDEEFTPTGKRLWTDDKYAEKLTNLATVVSGMGTELTEDGPAILGVCEIENRKVLQDFVSHPKVASRRYRIIHKESPDHRGIDVALLFQPKYFKPDTFEMLPVYFSDGKDTSNSRDILYVRGNFDGETLHVFVNHWPSRSGGAKATQHKREHCAGLIKTRMKQIYQIEPEAKILVMGDLNDDPSSSSVRNVLLSKEDPEFVTAGEMYNPMVDFFKKGIGTLAYRDSWNLFDQILLSSSWLNDDDGYTFLKSKIFNKSYLRTKRGKYKGYPFRTFSGDVYAGGYSDHFPVYIFAVQSIE